MGWVPIPYEERCYQGAFQLLRDGFYFRYFLFEEWEGGGQRILYLKDFNLGGDVSDGDSGFNPQGHGTEDVHNFSKDACLPGPVLAAPLHVYGVYNKR